MRHLLFGLFALAWASCGCGAPSASSSPSSPPSVAEPVVAEPVVAEPSPREPSTPVEQGLGSYTRFGSWDNELELGRFSDSIGGAGLDSSGRFLLVHRSREFAVLELATGRVRGRHAHRSMGNASTAFGPEERFAVLSGRTGWVLWDLETDTLTESEVRGVAFVDAVNARALAIRPGSLRLHRLADGEPIGESAETSIRSRPEPGRPFVVRSAGARQRWVLLDEDRFELWDAASPRRIATRRARRHYRFIYARADGTRFAVSTDRDVQIFSAEDGTRERVVRTPEPDLAPRFAQFSADGAALVIGWEAELDDGEGWVWHEHRVQVVSLSDGAVIGDTGRGEGSTAGVAFGDVLHVSLGEQVHRWSPPEDPVAVEPAIEAGERPIVRSDGSIAGWLVGSSNSAHIRFGEQPPHGLEHTEPVLYRRPGHVLHAELSPTP